MSTNMLRDRHLRDFTTPLAPCLGGTSAREALASRDKFFDSSRWVRIARYAPPRLRDVSPGACAVVVMRARGTTGGEQALFAALGEEIQQCVDDANDGAVVGGRGDGGVQGRVLRHSVRPGPPHAPALRGCAPSRLPPRGWPRAARRRWRLEMRRASKSSPPLAMREDDEGERLDQRLHETSRTKRPRPPGSR